MALNDLPYAPWLEQWLRDIVDKPVEAICIMTKIASDNEDLGDEIGSSYWQTTVADKLLFAGFLQQDAMIDTLKVNGYLPEDEEDPEDEQE